MVIETDILRPPIPSGDRNLAQTRQRQAFLAANIELEESRTIRFTALEKDVVVSYLKQSYRYLITCADLGISLTALSWHSGFFALIEMARVQMSYEEGNAFQKAVWDYKDNDHQRKRALGSHYFGLNDLPRGRQH
jgi:hypothetical protein